MRWTILLLDLALVGCFSAPPGEGREPERQNILVVMLDDLGYTDLGCYGGEIRTPTIDALADRGVRFTEFKTAPMCAPSRSMFLTGNDNHVAGFGRMLRAEHDSFYYGKPGYEAGITDRVATFPELLQAAGYRTAVTGKWHQGFAMSSDPSRRGFDQSFVLLNGYANHFNQRGLNLHGDDTLTTFRYNGWEVDWPEGHFSTQVYTDSMLAFLDKGNQDRPFFAFLSYTAPHWPLQLPDEWLDRYTGAYHYGYDSLRRKRFEGLGEEIPPPMETFPRWERLNDGERRRESRKMELYAAMVENADHHLGRVIDYLDRTGQLDRTTIIVLADNGASNTDFYNHPTKGDYARRYHSNALENMGTPDSYVAHGVQWANSLMAHKNYYKTWVTEGGISAPLVMAGPLVQALPEGEVMHEIFTIQDLAPTFLDLAGVAYPDDKAPMRGRSLLPYLRGEMERAHPQDAVFAAEHRGHAYVRRGDWKIVSLGGAGDTATFRLHNLATDPGERDDVSDTYPAIRAELLEAWEKFKKENMVLFP